MDEELQTPDQAIARGELVSAAAAGDIAAKTALGRHLLSQPPFQLAEGLKFIHEAAAEGGAEACHVAAVYAAFGVGVEQSWPTALDYSARAAQFGHALAQAEMAALTQEWSLVKDLAGGEKRDPNSWQSLRARIDIGAWLMVPPKGIVSRSPRMAVVKDMASPEICDWLIGRAGPIMKPATTYDPATAERVVQDARTNSDCHFGFVNSDLVLCFIQARMATLSELPMRAMEAPTVLHYTVGQYFAPHYDFLDPEFPGYARQIAVGGQRVLTFLMCLNEGYEGGETDFPTLGTRFKGERGAGLFFWNVEPDGSIDKRTLHAGQAPSKGEKWLLSQWARARLVAH